MIRVKRKSIPLSVKLDAALLALGLDPKAVDWHHEPPLAMRPFNPETGDTQPPQNDPRHIVPLARADHKARTIGNHGPLSGDVSKIAKLKRIERKRQAHLSALADDDSVRDGGAFKRRYKATIPNRPWPKKGDRK